MPFGLQPWHLLIALVVIVLVMGPKRLPEIGQAMGKTLRGFKDELDAKPADAPSTEVTPSVAAAVPTAPPVAPAVAAAAVDPATTPPPGAA
ncbi:MAG: twin-arginine translocase TatA/TatE family subunit [Candidatus Limnocylindrales bacterium]